MSDAVLNDPAKRDNYYKYGVADSEFAEFAEFQEFMGDFGLFEEFLDDFLAVVMGLRSSTTWARWRRC